MMINSPRISVAPPGTLSARRRAIWGFILLLALLLAACLPEGVQLPESDLLRYLVLSSFGSEDNPGIWVIAASGKRQPRFVAQGDIAFWSWE